MDVAVNYDTESVLHCIRRLQSLRGKIKTIISDPGSQLVGASNELKKWRQGWSQVELVQFGSKNGINWKFISASSQHQNGAAEVMVKLVKGVMKSLMHQIGAHILSLNEPNTVLMETSDLVNSRPIGIKPNRDADAEFLCPNSFLLGRNSDRGDAGPFRPKNGSFPSSRDDQERFKLVQDIVNQFWTVWIRNYFPTLLIRKKWHHRQRNLQKGDICLLQDANQVRGEFRRCKVSEVFPDKHGVVRNVEVLVAQKQNGLQSYHPQGLSRLRRHVNNLILILPVEENVQDCLATESDIDHTLSKESSIFRNLEEEAPFNSSQQLPDDQAQESSDSYLQGAFQVPVASECNLGQVSSPVENLGCSSWNLVSVKSRSQEEPSQACLSTDELLAGSVNLESCTVPTSATSSARTANLLDSVLYAPADRSKLSFS